MRQFLTGETCGRIRVSTCKVDIRQEFTDRSIHTVHRRGPRAELRLDGDGVDAAIVQTMAYFCCNRHEVLSWRSKNMQRGDHSRFGELPDMQLVYFLHAFDFKDGVLNLLQRDASRHTLEEDKGRALHCRRGDRLVLVGKQEIHHKTYLRVMQTRK